MDINYKVDQLVTIEYPGEVRNVEKMVKTFGGEKELNTIFNDSSKRLGLKFRPEDPYCKYAYGDRFNTTNLVLKVIKRTRKRKNISENTAKESEVTYKVEFLGLACTTFKFKAMADFQILPLGHNNGGYKSLIPQLVPHTLHPASWLDMQAPLFIQPLVYSRFDLPQNGYVDIEAKIPRNPLSNPLPPNIIGRSRKKRTNFAIFTTFESNEPCDEPNPQAIIEFNAHAFDVEFNEKIQEAFRERPIWTRNALIAKLSSDRLRLRNVLSYFAYYFTNGPWRTLWVRFGYDPRKDPSSKIYQVMDFRINASVLVKGDKKFKRKCLSNYPHLSKISQNQHRIAMINTDDLVPPIKDGDEFDDSLSKSSSNEYFPGILPTSRQCFYQLCDIHLEEVQEFVHQNDGNEQFCHERDGWLELGSLDKIREMIMADVIKTANLKELHN